MRHGVWRDALRRRAVGSGALAGAKDTTEAAWRGFREAMARAEEALAPVEETADPTVYLLEVNMGVASDDQGKIDYVMVAATAALSAAAVERGPKSLSGKLTNRWNRL